MTAPRPTPGASSADAPPLDYQSFYRKVSKLLTEIQEAESAPETLDRILQAVIRAFRRDLGIFSGRLYQRDGASYVLRRSYGGPRDKALEGFRLPRSYAPIKALTRRRVLYFDKDREGFDPSIESHLGVDRFAAIAIGPENAFLIAFGINRDIGPEHFLFCLNTIRHAIAQKLEHLGHQSLLNEVKEIQQSLLLEAAPPFPGYDLAVRSDPVESVGGDVYDFLNPADRTLGIMIADSSGHGLPAALQARDVVTGLRMGVERDLKITRTIEKLNHVVHHSGLTSRFISLFYGELEPNGNFLYINAGHCQPLYLIGSKPVARLGIGGPILGPIADVPYKRGFLHLDRGSMLVLYTDGITERANRRGQMFGERRLLTLLRKHRRRTAREIVRQAFRAVAAFGGRTPATDDQTLIVIKRHLRRTASEGRP